MTERLWFFDTTLRDGHRRRASSSPWTKSTGSPRFSMNWGLITSKAAGRGNPTDSDFFNSRPRSVNVTPRPLDDQTRRDPG